MNLIKIILVLAVFSVSALAQEIGGVKGTVRTPRGAAIPEVSITVRQNEQDVKTVMTNKNGDFVIDKLKAGKYSFVFSKDGFTSGSLNNVEVGKNKIRDLGSRLVLDVDEGNLVIVRGAVFNQDGRSIFGAKIEIAKVLENGAVKKLDSKYSSQSGEFVFRFNKGAATFRITASVDGKSATKDVTVDEAAIYRTALTLNLEKDKDKNDNDN
ncbi:MAG TPA: carboxypeptidase regulatory-like domain-containing protein [Pyrinomonadaceae bacterium]|nr:carboxypeptidase regulatory-like domain-containing protein [Pyrinomonadaceae bacterium]